MSSCISICLLFKKRIWYLILAKSAKSTKSAKSEAKDDAKSDITDGNNTSAAESTIPLDDDVVKSNGDLPTKSGKYYYQMLLIRF